MKLDRDMTMAEFNEKYPSTIPIERVAVVNGLDARRTGYRRGRW